MIKTSLIIPVYNEIKFIERTLLFAIEEGDEVIISDNASTDGTSEICQGYAKKYPRINYTRHNENMGSYENFRFCLNKANGKYTRIIGGHDLISRGSSRSMSKILDENPDAVLSYSKKTLFVNSDYSFSFLYSAEEFKSDLSSDFPHIRVKSLVEKLCNCSIFYGLYKTEIFKKAINGRFVLEKIISDHVVLTNLAAIGKFIPDDSSTFYRIEPRIDDVSWVESCRRIIRSVKKLDDINLANPYEWLFEIITGSYEVAKKVQCLLSTPKDFDKQILQIAINRFGYPPGFDVTLKNVDIFQNKKHIADEVFSAIQIAKENMLQKKSLYKKVIGKIWGTQ
ncbi:MAG: glycosyltransferase [Tannerella sp.]|jgi:glycosyltransferase involved in cell wall biosynthesis|nr:glycosyltransferase [Tannerella sp.]